MRLLLDTDVVLDLALNRAPFVATSEMVLAHCQRKTHSGVLAWHTVANVYYFLRKAQGDSRTRGFIHELIEFCSVARGGVETVRHALSLQLSDFEDSLQVSAGLAESSQFIITRNLPHFRNSPLPPLTPAQFLNRFHGQ